MHLALRMNLFRAAKLEVPMDLVRGAEDLGYHSVWSAEAYGSMPSLGGSRGSKLRAFSSSLAISSYPWKIRNKKYDPFE